jgi:transcriptional regulator with XRE-family HTH domain
MTTVHSRIKEARLKLGLSQEKFADEVGVSRQAVQQWETEPDPANPEVKSTAPKRTLMPQVAKILGVSVAYLATGKDASGGDLNPLEQQAISMYRDVPPEFQEAMLQSLNQIWALANRGKPASPGDPFGGKKPPKKAPQK